jgi:hypothetical protein
MDSKLKKFWEWCGFTEVIVGELTADQRAFEEE